MADYETLSVSDKVGIGTETPLTQLHIASSTSTPSQAFLESSGALLKIKVDSSGASIGTDNAFSLSILTDNSPRLSITDDGKVGIGTTTTPTERLEVDGNVKANSFWGNGATLDGIVKKAGDTMTGSLTINNNLTVNGAIATSSLSVTANANIGGNLKVDGNVGIGTTNPDTPLHIESDNADRGLRIGAKDKNTEIYLHIAGGDYGFLGLGGETKLRGNGKSSTFSGNLQIVRDGWTYLDIRCSKVGEDAVIRLFDGVKDSNSEHYWSIHNDDSAGNKLDIRSNNSSKMSLTTEGHLTIGGNVGIGTQNPQAKLEVAGALKLSKAGTLLFHNTNESGNPNGDGFRIRYDNNFFGTGADVLVVEKTDGNQANPDGGIAFVNTGNDGVVETALVIKGNGNVGIGTTSPVGKLDVWGYLYVGGQLAIDDNNYWHRAQSSADNHYGFFEVRRKTNNRRGCYLGYGSPGKYVDLRLEEGNALAITGGKVGIGTNSPEADLHVIGKLLGAAQDTSGKALRICCGKTAEGSTNWQVYVSPKAIYVDVDTSACGFNSTPIYIVNMHGNSNHWTTTGGSSAYNRTATGFTIYVRFIDSRELTPGFANQKKWHIQWIAIGN